MKQLKGKPIAIQRLGDLTHIAAREALNHVELAESDLQMQQIGGGPARFTALHTGNVQAAILTPPYSTRARKLGYRVPVNLYDLKIPFIGTGVVTTKQLLATRRPLVLNLLTAIAEGIRYYKRERDGRSRSPNVIYRERRGRRSLSIITIVTWMTGRFHVVRDSKSPWNLPPSKRR